MKHLKSGNLRGWAATGLLTGAVALAAGCVEHRVAYVPAVRTEAAYEAPGPVVAAAPAPPPPMAPAALPPVSDAVAAPVPVASPAPAVVLRSSAELDQMLGPIALYPDPLIAQVLPAATLPEQVVLADRYVRGGGDAGQIDAQPWDLSVKALARYPGVLQMMDDNLAWTTDLGQAFLNQPSDVMDAIQRLRAEAQAMGNLQSTPEQAVVMDEGDIEIVPANPDVIYVPVYQPDVVFVRPPPGPGRWWISFGVGFRIGAWLNHDCDWHGHDLIVWHTDHPRPKDWWYHPAGRPARPVVVNRVTVVNNRPGGNQPFTVWHPQARPAVARTDQGDRGWNTAEARPAPAPAPREVHPAPPPKTARPAPAAKESHPVVVAKDARPVTPPKEARPAPGPQRPTAAPAPRQAAPVTPPKEVRPAPAPKPAPQVAPRPAPAPAPARPAPRVEPPAPRPSSALAGIENTRVTRESSSRGQQSRETISRPEPPPRAPAPAARAPSGGGGGSTKHK